MLPIALEGFMSSAVNDTSRSARALFWFPQRCQVNCPASSGHNRYLLNGHPGDGLGAGMYTGLGYEGG